MAYKSKNYYKKYKKAKRKGKWNWARTGSVAVKAAKALALAYALKDSTNIEYKEIDVSDSRSAVQTGYITPLTAIIPVGPGNGERIGDSVKLQRLTMRYYVSSTTPLELCRIMIYNDKQNSITTGAQMLSFDGTALAVVSPKKEDNKYQTQILFDKLLQVGSSSPSGSIHGKIQLPLNFHEHWEAGTNVPKDNCLKMAVWSSTSSPNVVTVNYVLEVSYTDN